MTYIRRGVPLSEAQVRHQYEIEKELAARLRNASREERQHLYRTLYDELFRRVPEHPQLTTKADPRIQEQTRRFLLQFVRPYLGPDRTFMEIGSGDCAFAFELCALCRRVVGVDVSEEITTGRGRPDNFELLLIDGASIEVPPESVDVVFSNQLMEHLHPEDALEQLRSIQRALVPGGVYICLTPHRFCGPCDISRYFDEVATGFHLKEYTYSELVGLFREAGFRRFESVKVSRGRRAVLPLWSVLAVEKALSPLPHRMRRGLARRTPFRQLLSIGLAGFK